MKNFQHRTMGTYSTDISTEIFSKVERKICNPLHSFPHSFIRTLTFFASFFRTLFLDSITFYLKYFFRVSCRFFRVFIFCTISLSFFFLLHFLLSCQCKYFGCWFVTFFFCKYKIQIIDFVKDWNCISTVSEPAVGGTIVSYFSFSILKGRIKVINYWIHNWFDSGSPNLGDSLHFTRPLPAMNNWFTTRCSRNKNELHIFEKNIFFTRKFFNHRLRSTDNFKPIIQPCQYLILFLLSFDTFKCSITHYLGYLGPCKNLKKGTFKLMSYYK